uniref:Uncharacterized protein n=1 Tax=Anopheles darlingi TaxID=43151 RepID=A0A2M4D6Z0_ANODA
MVLDDVGRMHHLSCCVVCIINLLLLWRLLRLWLRCAHSLRQMLVCRATHECTIHRIIILFYNIIRCIYSRRLLLRYLLQRRYTLRSRLVNNLLHLLIVVSATELHLHIR